MTLLISRIILTLVLLGMIYLVWVNNVDLLKWGEKKVKELLPISEQSDPGEHAEKLSGFIKEAQQLRTRLNENPLPIKDHNEWVERVNKYLKENLGSAYEVRFNDFSGMTFYGDNSEKSKMSRSLEGRSRRLHEFISEKSR